jgi:hypothetical protein
MVLCGIIDTERRGRVAPQRYVGNSENLFLNTSVRSGVKQYVFILIHGGIKWKFRRIEYFLVLAEKLNYTKAAAELFIFSSGLTKQIVVLEEELELSCV